MQTHTFKLPTRRDILREFIQRVTAEYIASGGTVTICPTQHKP